MLYMTDPFTPANPAQHPSGDTAPCVVCGRITTRTTAHYAWLDHETHVGPCCSALCIFLAKSRIDLARKVAHKERTGG